jgi:hypothetical protein
MGNYPNFELTKIVKLNSIVEAVSLLNENLFPHTYPPLWISYSDM